MDKSRPQLVFSPKLSLYSTNNQLKSARFNYTDRTKGIDGALSE